MYRRRFPDNRGIAQPGSAAVLGTAGRWFESSCPDQLNQLLSENIRGEIFPEIAIGKVMGRPKKYFRAGHVADEGKWQIEGWGAAQGQISAAIEFLCKGKSPSARAMIADELVALVRSLARGNYPEPQALPFDRDEHARESWARASAHHIVDGALSASERAGGPLPSPDQVSLLREIARRALWHIPNSADEARNLVRYIDIENLRQPNPFDDEPPGG